MEKVELTIDETQTLDILLHQVLNQALVAIGAEAGSLMLVDAKQGILQTKARLGPPRSGRKTEVIYRIDGAGIAPHVVRSKTSYLCRDVGKDTRFLASRSGKNFSSLLAVPIVHGDEVLAVINADAPRKNSFSETHRKLLESVARQVAAPIASRISLLAAMAQVGVELARPPGEGGVEQVLKRIGDLAFRSLGANPVILYPYIQEKDEFPVEGTGPIIAGDIHDSQPMRRRVFKGDVPWTVVKERKSDFYSDVRKYKFLTGIVKRSGDTPRPRFIEREGIKSMAVLLLPFRAVDDSKAEVVGVMFANYRTDHDFNIDERHALATFADYAAAAILNARHDERRRSEEAQLGKALSAQFNHGIARLATAERATILRVLKDDTSMQKTSKLALKRVVQEADLLFDLCEKWADWTRAFEQVSEASLMHLAPIIQGVLRKTAARQSKLKVHRDLPRNLPRVKSVELALREVLQNLLDNALDAMRASIQCQLTVAARYMPLRNCVEVRISDTGCGISGDKHDRLFAPEPSKKEKGLGMGLFLSRMLIRAIGGDLKCEKTCLGEGSTFLVEIPCESTHITCTRDDSTSRSLTYVLIVDDDPNWLRNLREDLTDEQYEVVTARAFAQAEEVLATHQFDLAIIDVNLMDQDSDNRDGLRLADRIKQAGLGTKIILISNWPDDNLRRARESNTSVIAFFDKKRYDPKRFRTTVHRAMGPHSRSKSRIQPGRD